MTTLLCSSHKNKFESQQYFAVIMPIQIYKICKNTYYTMNCGLKPEEIQGKSEQERRRTLLITMLKTTTHKKKCVRLCRPPGAWSSSSLRTWPHSTPPPRLPRCPSPSKRCQCQGRCVGSPLGARPYRQCGLDSWSMNLPMRQVNCSTEVPLLCASASVHTGSPPKSPTHPHSPPHHPRWQ